MSLIIPNIDTSNILPALASIFKASNHEYRVLRPFLPKNSYEAIRDFIQQKNPNIVITKNIIANAINTKTDDKHGVWEAIYALAHEGALKSVELLAKMATTEVVTAHAFLMKSLSEGKDIVVDGETRVSIRKTLVVEKLGAVVGNVEKKEAK